MNKEVISSRQNPLVKFVCGLAEKKNRRESGLFRFDGIKLLGEALSSDVKIKYVVCKSPMNDVLRRVVDTALSEGRITPDTVLEVSDSVFEKMSEEKAPEGVITVAHALSSLHEVGEFIPSKEKKILIAESLRDPGNLGTVMRSCYALGIDRLIITDDCADIYNPKTIRAAMGAVFKMRTQSVEAEMLPSFIGELVGDGRRVYATALAENSRNIGEIRLAAGDCFVIGNEGHGLTDGVIRACSDCVIIPMREDAESLNAAAAASICIWETVRGSI
ncbi:MAG: RNA methyltransferase [Ruminococcaceae bacterium]|nr:RNA methyltransferase [Oscillospiraceae bacterium]